MTPSASRLAEALRPLLGSPHGAEDEAWEELARVAIGHDYPRGNILFYDGEPCDAVHVLLSGRAKISLTSEEGREVVLAVMRSRGVFGIAAAVDGGPHIGTATTTADSRIAKIPTGAFLRWLARHPECNGALAAGFAGVIRAAYGKIGEHALLPVKERLLATLREIARSEGEQASEDEVVFIRPTHRELAELVGSTRVVISRSLKELIEEDRALRGEGKVMRVRMRLIGDADAGS